MEIIEPKTKIYSELWRLQIHEFVPFLQVTLDIREFTTVKAQNISDLEDQPWKSKLLRMPFLVRLESLTVLR